MKIKTYFAIACAAGIGAAAQAQSHAAQAPQKTDLRSTLKQVGATTGDASTHKLSPEQRAALRQQLAQPPRRDGKRT